MLHKFYNTMNISNIYISPFCRVVDNMDNQIVVINTITNQRALFRGTEKSMDLFRKSFILNVGMKYEDLEAFFANFENCTLATWQELIQGGFLE